MWHHVLIIEDEPQHDFGITKYLIGQGIKPSSITHAITLLAARDEIQRINDEHISNPLVLLDRNLNPQDRENRDGDSLIPVIRETLPEAFIICTSMDGPIGTEDIFLPKFNCQIDGKPHYSLFSYDLSPENLRQLVDERRQEPHLKESY